MLQLNNFYRGRRYCIYTNPFLWLTLFNRDVPMKIDLFLSHTASYAKHHWLKVLTEWPTWLWIHTCFLANLTAAICRLLLWTKLCRRSAIACYCHCSPFVRYITFVWPVWGKAKIFSHVNSQSIFNVVHVATVYWGLVSTQF